MIVLLGFVLMSHLYSLLIDTKNAFVAARTVCAWSTKVENVSWLKDTHAVRFDGYGAKKCGCLYKTAHAASPDLPGWRAPIAFVNSVGNRFCTRRDAESETVVTLGAQVRDIPDRVNRLVIYSNHTYLGHRVVSRLWELDVGKLRDNDASGR